MTDWLYLSTGDARLDSILDSSGRGFRYSPRNAIRVLVKGEPGTGKSMLVTQMALRFCHERKGPGQSPQGTLFYSLDEDAQKIKERVSSLKIAPHATSVVGEQYRGIKGVCSDGKDTVAELRRSGGMVIFHASPPLSELPIMERDQRDSGSEPDLQHVVLPRIVSLARRIEADAQDAKKTLRWERCLIVVDSINTMFECTTEQLCRSTLRILFEGPKVTSDDCCFVFVAETSGQILPEEYLTDSVILVEADKNTGARFLTITKARDHAVRPVRHRLMIDAQGARIIPQTAQPSSRYAPHDLCRFEEKNLDNLLTLRLSLGEQVGKDSEGDCGFYRGSSTLLVGPPGTRKTLIALQFIRGGLKKGKEEERGTIISFSPQESGFFNFYRDFIFAGQGDVALKILEMPPLLEEVEDVILGHSIEADPRPSRLVIHDCGDLLRHFDERSVLQMVTRLRVQLMQSQLTTIFVMTLSSIPNHAPEGGGKFSLLADNVMSTTFVGEHGSGKKATAVCVRKLRGVYLSPRFVEYSYAPTAQGPALSTDFLADVIESRSGELSLGGLRVYYYSGETDALNNLADYQRDLLSGHYPGPRSECPRVIFFGQSERHVTANTPPARRKDLGCLDRESLLESITFHPPFARRDRSEVVMFDQPWTPKLQSHLIPLDNMLTQDERRELGLGPWLMLTNDEKRELASIPPGIRASFKSDRDEVLGLPYYHNFLTLC